MLSATRHEGALAGVRSPPLSERPRCVVEATPKGFDAWSVLRAGRLLVLYRLVCEGGFRGSRVQIPPSRLICGDSERRQNSRARFGPVSPSDPLCRTAFAPRLRQRGAFLYADLRTALSRPSLSARTPLG